MRWTALSSQTCLCAVQAIVRRGIRAATPMDFRNLPPHVSLSVLALFEFNGCAQTVQGSLVFGEHFECRAE